MCKWKIVLHRKSFYGLKQAPVLLFNLLSKTFLSIGFYKINLSDSMFMLNDITGFLILLAYVDALLITGTQLFILHTPQHVARFFKISELGNCTHFLVTTINYISYTPNVLHLLQQYLIQNHIKQAKMEAFQAVTTPLPSHHSLREDPKTHTDFDKDPCLNAAYRATLENLMYLSTRTRPDIYRHINAWKVYR